MMTEDKLFFFFKSFQERHLVLPSVFFCTSFRLVDSKLDSPRTQARFLKSIYCNLLLHQTECPNEMTLHPALIVSAVFFFFSFLPEVSAVFTRTSR